MHVRKVTIVLVVLLLSLVAGAAMAQTNLPPTDPVCGTQRTYGERTYTVACLRQFIAPSLQPMTFPGNSTGGTFPGNGVVLPN